MLNVARSILIIIWAFPFLCTICTYTGSLPIGFINHFLLKLLYITSFLSASFLFLEWLLALRTILAYNKVFTYLRENNLPKLNALLNKIPIQECYERGKTVLQYAIDNQMHVDIVTFLLSKDGLVTYKFNKEYNTSYTLYYLAARYDYLNEKIVNYLLNKGAYIDFVDNSQGFNSLSLLQAFILRCHYPIVELLIDKGVDLHYVIPELDMNALMLAAKYISNIKIITLLCTKGNNISQANSNGYTPILFAAEYNPSAEVIETLVNQGAKIEEYDIKGPPLNINTVTPLRLAAANNNIEVIQKLIELGDNVNYKDMHGFSVFFVAALHNTDVHVLQLLLDYGARLDQSNDPNNNTPLMGAACLNPNIEVINFLIRTSNNLNRRNNVGLSFLDYLQENTALDPIDKEKLLQKFTFKYADNIST